MTRGARAAALPIAVGCIVAIAWGVSAWELARFAAYQLALLAVGVLLWLAASGERRVGLRGCCIGFALGHIGAIAAFALAASLGARSLLPVAIAAPALGALALVMRRRGRDGNRNAAPLPNRWPLACAGVVSLGLVYLAVAYFTQTPLPAEIDRVAYYQDYMFHLSVSAEALHHWPIGEPKVAGEPLPYHTFFYMDVAAAAHVTGIELPVLLFRLIPLTLIGAAVLQFAWAGRALTGLAWAGPLTALLLIAVGELDPSAEEPFVFYNSFFSSLHTSPTYLLGMIVFTPALVLSGELVGAVPDEGRRRGKCIVLGALFAAAAGIKASILPVLAGGLLGYAAVRLVLDRRPPNASLALTGLALLIVAISYLVVYDSGEGGLALDPPGSIAEMRPVLLLERHVEGIPVLEQGFWVVVAAAGIAGFCAAPLGGSAWLLRARLQRVPRRVLLLVSVFLAGLVPFLVLGHPGGSQNFFTYYGYAAVAPLAAAGLLSLVPGLQLSRRRWLLAGTAAVGGVGAALALGAAADGSELRHYAIWFGVPLIALAAVAVRSRSGRVVAATALIAVLAYGALDTPLDVGSELVERARADEPSYPTEGRGLTSDLYDGLRWVREETPADAELAASNYWIDDAEKRPFYSYYSGLAERRVFLEGWGLTIGTVDAGLERVYAGEVNPYPERFALNEAVFTDGEPDALARLRGEGVDYLLVDRANRDAPGVRRLPLGDPVFANEAISIYSIGGAR